VTWPVCLQDEAGWICGLAFLHVWFGAGSAAGGLLPFPVG
jgi:hypothetical protein